MNYQKLYEDSKFQVHATNVTGLGATQVAASLINSICKNDISKHAVFFFPDEGLLKHHKPSKGKTKRFRRYLPLSVSRLIECLFAKVYFKNIPTIVLGDIPLYGIKNQIVLVHQPNLVYPMINHHSSKSIKFRILRKLFAFNQKFADVIIVQTGAIADDLILSYPGIKGRVIIQPQPAPDWLQSLKHEENNKEILDNNFIFFYPAAHYPHKKHSFLIDINNYIKFHNIKPDFEIWVTLNKNEFKKYEDIKFLKNIGRIPSQKMNEIYNQVDALLFLSSMESYGLPLVESLIMGLPILVADHKYSKWMCEQCAYYFKPYDPSSFIDEKTQLLTDYAKQSSFQTNFDEILGKFPKNWDEVAFEFIKFVKNRFK
jgi:hypothetical protein